MDSTRQQKILDAAHRAFLRHGFKRITMQEIADAAGISRPALYLVYQSKEEVFSEVIRQNTIQACDAIAREAMKVATGSLRPSLPVCSPVTENCPLRTWRVS